MSDGPLSVAPVRSDSVQRREARPGGDTRDAQGILRLVPEQWRVAEDELAQVQQDRLREKYAPVVQALRERGYDESALFDTLDLGGGREMAGEGEYNRVAIWQYIKRERELAKQQGRADPFAGLPGDRVTFEQPELTRFGARERDQYEISRAPGTTQFVSGLIGGGALEMRRPLNIATLPVGGFGKGIAMKVLTQGLTQAGITTIGLPEQIVGRQAMGEEYTTGEALMNIGGAAVGGMVLQGAVDLAPAAGRVLNDKVIQPAIRKIDPDWDDKQIAKVFGQMVPPNLRTPEQEAALFVLQRSAEVEDVNPYVRTHEAIDAHVTKMDEALRAIEEGRIPSNEELRTASTVAAPPVPAARPVAQGFDRESVKAAIRGPESAGDDFATNRAGSSAAGRYQFIEETFVRLYQREYGVSEAAAQAAWTRNRFDVGVQERLMDRLLDENARALNRAGFDADPGNLYLAHFAGEAKAVELLRAPKDAPVSDFFTAKAIRQNSTYLGGGKTVGEAIDIIRGKVGDAGQRSPAPIDPRLLEPELRNPDLDAERPSAALIDEKALDTGLPEPVQALIDPLREIVTGTRTSLNRTAELATELGTDEATLRSALESLVERGDITQNSATGKFMRKAAAPVTAANQKRPRTLLEFLAERGGLNDYGGDLRALGIRRNDRRMGAKIIRNILNEEGGVKAWDGDYGLDTAFQDAREAGYFPELEGRVENAYADAVDGPAMLLQAINEELSGSARYRMDDWDRLPEFKLTGSTEGIYGGRFGPEDANPDDFGPYAELVDKFRAEWESFGNDLTALDALDADTLSRAAWLYDTGEAFLPEHALARVAAADYERALEAAIKEGLADEYPTLDPWNPEWRAEFERRYDAAIARDRANGNPVARPEGVSFDEAYGGQGRAQPGSGGRDRAGQGPSPAELDAAAAAKPRSDHTELPPDPDPRFNEPDGPGIVAAADSAWHDIDAALKGEAATDPNIAARQAQEAQLGAQAPMRARVDQDSEMGLGLFDAVDQKSLFDLGDGRGERTVADIRADIDADRTAIEEIKKCLI